ncbi:MULTISPECIES: TraV family lipoprotein [Salinisphaera]|uniref:TraV family lipoprotein n=1 Tax=Salinisphaera TaxID=180541 RepID=UPI00334110A1
MSKSNKNQRFARMCGIAGTLTLISALSGCASLGYGESEFNGCPDTDHGVACMSAREVYRQTEDRDALTSADMKAHENHEHDEVVQAPVAGPAARPFNHAPALPAVDGPIPLRTPARVMRIRLSYWQSDDGNLHVPGYIYTEIEPRRWQVGLQEPGAAPVLHPLQTVAPVGGDETSGQQSRSGRQNGNRM